MPTQAGTVSRGRNAGRALAYFFLDVQVEAGKPAESLLHRVLNINRGKDRIVAWCYPLGKRMTYSYSEVRKRKRPAYSTAEVAKMLNRSVIRVEHAIWNGHITPPQQSYGMDENRNRFAYFWDEHNIMEAHEHFSNQHRGRPRKDGLITPQHLPTARELRAMIRQEQMFYIKNENDEFVPVWMAPDFT